MKSKVTILALVISAGIVGYWYGRHRTAKYYQDVVLELTIRNRALDEIRERAQLNLHLLTELHGGAQSQVEETLERQLSVAVAGLGAAWDKASGDQIYGNDIFLIRDIHGYRSQHPWTNDAPQIAERVQVAFKLAERLLK